MGNRFYYGMPATQAFQAMNAMDDDMQAKVVAAGGSATAAAGSATAASSSVTQANSARDAAIAAWQASTAPTEQLAAISAQLHAGAVVDVFLYDTSRDSDGGAWRKRCRHTSWENEALVTGKWLGMQATGSAVGISAAGGVVGDYFQYTADNRYYRVDSLAGAGVFTEVFRGNVREFPALALIVVEASRLVIYDATQPSLPMWMVFTAPVANWNSNLLIGGSLSGVVAINGLLCISQVGNSQGVVAISFPADGSKAYTNTGLYGGKDNAPLANRNSGVGHTFSGGTVAHGLPLIVNNTVNDVVAAILPIAPIDPATGLPIPHIAVATAGGVSILKPDGTVANLTTFMGSDMRYVCFHEGEVFFSPNAPTNTQRMFHTPIASAVTRQFTGSDLVYQESGIPSTCNFYLDAIRESAKTYLALAGKFSGGLTFLKTNPAITALGMVAAISNTYNSGWMVGDVRGAWLADTVAEIVTGAELITNGTFAANTAGWVAAPNYACTATAVGGAMRVTATAPYGAQWQSFPTVIGKTYVFSAKGRKVSGVDPFYFALGNPATGADAGYLSQFIAASNTTFVSVSTTFVATAATTWILLRASTDHSSGEVTEFDDVSVKLAAADRSVKAKGLVVNGSITKAAVAAGAQLVSYSGFSAANYLEQPYNSDLDFGTGDFCYMGWVYITDLSQYTGLLHRSQQGQGGGLYIQISNGAGGMTIYCTTSSAYTAILSAPAAVIQAYVPTLVEVSRASGTLKVKLNGVPVASGPSTENLTFVGAVLRLGCQSSGNEVVKGWMALWRASATAPSDDQSAQIYRDELPLFQAGAQCAVDGTSNAVTALAYDDTTDLLHVGTSWGRSAFKGLRRIESAATQVGSITALAAGQGAHITGGATAARFARPAITLRDELLRKEEARRAMACEEIPLDFDGIAGQTAFTLPIGFKAKNVSVAGARKRLGTTKDYTVSYDGYRETVNFGVSPGATWVQITANRSI